MSKNNVPFKAAVGYGIVAVILVIAIILVYSNTRSLMAISESVREYAARQERTDSAMAQLLSDEQENLRQLNDALDNGHQAGALRRKVKSLQTGKDSVVVKPKTTEEHRMKNTTVEVARTRKGFFRRFADLFRKAHADTVSVKHDSAIASVDTVTKHVDVSKKIAKILNDADREERKIANNRQKDVKKELEDLKTLTTVLSQEQTKKMELLRKNEHKLIHKDMEKALQARHRLVLQIIMLSVLAIATAIILLWRMWQDNKREQAYREALERANAETKRVMEQRERLLLTITHDIKAPAASITGFTELLKNYISSPKGLSLLGNVHDSAVHLSQLVANLLDYHQLEDGQIKVNNTTFSPSQLASQCIMGMKPRADAKGLALNVSTTGCEGITCTGDAFRIRQIIDNLLSNAVKYTDMGSVTLKMAIKSRHESSADKMLCIEVVDTGKGIAEKDRATIFQAFKRLGNAQGIEGTGLGLSIVSQLVTLLGGEISLNSVVGKGSTFIVSLPLAMTAHVASREAEDDGNDAPNIQATAGDVPVPKTYRNHQLLILDDDPLQLKLLQEMVRQIAGDSWTVTACGNVTEALTKIHDLQPALMFMDIEMPEMNGTDFIRHIDHHDMTVVAMTAHDESIKATLREAGFDGCLFKPIKAERLANVLGIDAVSGLVPATSQDSNQIPVSNPESGSADLLSFASDDPEILEAINTEVKDYGNQLSAAVNGSAPDRKTIAKVAHKLLPLAKMLNLHCVKDLEMLTPEKIEASSDAEIIMAVRNTTKEIS